MSPEEFFDKFETFAEVTQAITKLRGLILRLAFQGCLSEYSSDDESIESLLTQVENDRKKSRGKSLEPVRPDEVDCSIPSRWRWVRFGEVAKHNAGKTLDKKRNAGTPRDYITTSNLYWGRFELDQLRQMLIKDEEMERCTARKGDLLICEGGDAGRAAVWPYEKEVSFQNHVHRARFFAEINPYFVYRYFEKLNATGEINQFRKGVGISSMSGKALASIPVPLPPLAEQKRIVAKVDALMGWCDRLEALQAQRDTQHAALARAALARFAENPTPQTLQALFHDQFPINPNDLRKSILTMAVQGKLVEQCKNDGDASELLTTIRNEQKQSNHKTPKVKASAEIDSDSTIPQTWKVTQLSEIALQIQYGYTASADPEISEVRMLRITDIHNNRVNWDSVPGCVIDDETAQKYLLQPNDILIARTGGTIGKSFIVPDAPVRSVFASYLIRVTPPSAMNARYLKLCLESPSYWSQLQKMSAGTGQPNVNGQALGQLVIPLPPLAEQRRIVAKVDELMALVDRLDEHQRQAHDLGQRLLTAAIAELTAVEEPIAQ